MSEERNASDDLAVCDAATSGYWIVTSDPSGGAPGTVVCTADGKAVADTWFLREPAPGHGKANAKFIAMARTALPYWIHRTVAAKMEVERLKASWKSLHFLARQFHFRATLSLARAREKEEDDLIEDCTTILAICNDTLAAAEPIAKALEAHSTS